MEWLGHASINFIHCPDPLPLKTKEGKTTDLLTICEESTPPCRLNPLLFNGHLQTMWTVMKFAGPPVFYKRKIFDAEDPTYHGTFAVDFVVEPYTDTDDTLPIRTTYFNEQEFDGIASLDSKPMLVALHGLAGGSYEIYLRHVLHPLIQQEAGWEACVINSRGCANHKITSSILYNARATWDCRQTVKWLRKKFPNRPLYGIGFSLGANILTNYIGEEGSACMLKAAVVISSPWNLDASNHALQRSWIGKEVYSKTMGRNMVRLVKLHAEEIGKNPKIDMEAIDKVKYLHELDRAVQGPTWGYPTEGAYYRDASSVDSMLAARIPLFAINAADDPIANKEALPYEEMKQNPYAVMCTTSLGGHLSWFEIGGGRWHAKPAINFLNNMLKLDLETESISVDKADSVTARFDPMRRRWNYHA
ncbi:alpha hydrolase-22 [Coleophoma cylindrospora]|uniref:alcohol O-acetyltransferase n=1 Tax=Coleophoma cylindrospora TaxID=1849047 RepID=A0A3D8SUJ4_9HELO|nr:alpha hydrolase-22 [Coleophoma cylindrospora]